MQSWTSWEKSHEEPGARQLWKLDGILVLWNILELLSAVDLFAHTICPLQSLDVFAEMLLKCQAPSTQNALAAQKGRSAHPPAAALQLHGWI